MSTVRRSAGSRPGGTLQSVLITLAAAGALGTAAIVIGPRYLVAGLHGRPGPGLTAARDSDHQALIEDLARLVDRSVGLLTILPRGATPYEEVVLWLTDDDPTGARGRPDDAELALLSHSEVLQTVTIYRRKAGVAAGADRRSAAFCNAWRADPNVEPLILARGVTAMRFECVGEPREEWGAWGPHGGLQRLRLDMSWAPDSSGGADEASVVVDTVIFGE